MNRPIRISDEARADFNAKIEYHENIRTGLGTRFRKLVLKKLEDIEFNPYLYSPGPFGVRKAIVDKFQYLIHYRIRAEDIEVIAIGHAKRKSSFWKDRLR